MENQHRHIKGYRDLSAEEIALMNEIKQHAEQTEALVGKVYARISAQYAATLPSYAEPKNAAEEVVGTDCIDTPEQSQAKAIERERLTKAEMFRWQSIAKTELQNGFMALVRAIAQPTTF